MPAFRALPSCPAVSLDLPGALRSPPTARNGTGGMRPPPAALGSPGGTYWAAPPRPTVPGDRAGGASPPRPAVSRDRADGIPRPPPAARSGAGGILPLRSSPRSPSPRVSPCATAVAFPGPIGRQEGGIEARRKEGKRVRRRAYQAGSPLTKSAPFFEGARGPPRPRPASSPIGLSLPIGLLRLFLPSRRRLRRPSSPLPLFLIGFSCPPALWSAPSAGCFCFGSNWVRPHCGCLRSFEAAAAPPTLLPLSYLSLNFPCWKNCFLENF